MGATVEAVTFAALPGWADDDHGAAFATFLVSCRALAVGAAPLRAGLAPSKALEAVCRMALAEPPSTPFAARRFFETRFTPWRVHPALGGAFFTGYYEPEVEGSLTRTGRFATPILDRPPDLVTLPRDASPPPGLEDYSAARRRPDGALEVYPDRAAIEAGALDRFALVRAYVADPVDRFFMQVQGSGRIRLPDGGTVRLAYSGRNGHPYTPIGRLVADREGIPRSDMTMDVLRAYLAKDPERASAVMRENHSFVFFRLAPELDPALGPIGGQGVPLTPGRSLAVDRSLWPYGLPVFVDAALPPGPGLPQPFRRLMVAQDTGAAIVGPARADIFFGAGRAMGAIAGAVRHGGEFVVLWPSDEAAMRP
jgi:membrane-bound lytic murein transglycosylase A